MQMTDVKEAASQLDEYLPAGSQDMALNMVKLAAHVAGEGRGVPVCTTGSDGKIVSVVCDRGWLKI